LWVAINGRHMRFLVVFKCTANQAWTLCLAEDSRCIVPSDQSAFIALGLIPKDPHVLQTPALQKMPDHANSFEIGSKGSTWNRQKAPAINASAEDRTGLKMRSRIR
jgi:hypothetical protein